MATVKKHLLIIGWLLCAACVSYAGVCDIEFNYSVTPPSAPGANDGQIDLTLTILDQNGQPTTDPNVLDDLVFSWSNGATTEDLQGLASGTYTVTVSGVAGSTPGEYGPNNPCYGTTFNSVISVAVPCQGLHIKWFEVQDATCGIMTDGSIDVSVSGGNPPYSFSWSNGSTTEDISSLSPGQYNLIVTNLTTGCSASQVFTVGVQDGINIDGTVVPDCITGAGASFNITSLSGGYGPYSYLWSNGETNADIYGLAPGYYEVTITDQNGCTGTYGEQILDPQEPVIDVESTNSGQCNLANGSITIDLLNPNDIGANTIFYDVKSIGGNVIYNQGHSLNLNGGTTELTIGGLVNSEYEITAWTASGCTTITTIDVCCLPEFEVFYEETGCKHFFRVYAQHPTIPGQLVDPSTLFGFSGISWTSSTNSIQTNPGHSNAASSDLGGTFTVTVEFRNCSWTHSWGPLSLPSGSRPTIDVINTTKPSCKYGSDGSADIQVQTFNGGGSCMDAHVRLETLGGTLLFSQLVTEQPPGCDETETVLISNLSAGFYNIIVTDNISGCTKKKALIIDEGDATFNQVDATPIQPTSWCSADGSITGSFAANGSNSPIPPYTYELYQNLGFGNNNLLTSVTSSAPLHTFQNLGAGDYNIKVIDSRGCYEWGTVTSITQPSAFFVQPYSSAACDQTSADGTAGVVISGSNLPVTYAWSNGGITSQITNVTPGTYHVTITDVNGCSKTNQVNVGVAPPLNTSINVVESCTPGSSSISTQVMGGRIPYQFQWSNGSTSQEIQNLHSGVYSVTITDDCGATATHTTEIFGHDDLFISTNTIDASCAGGSDGSATAIVTQGSGPFAYTWYDNQSTAIGTGPLVENLSAGSYTLEVTSSTGCITMQGFTISEPTAIAFNGSVSVTGCQATVSVTGGNSPYTVEIHEVDGNGVPQVGAGSQSGITTSAVFDGLGANDYTVVVYDANGCQLQGNDFTIQGIATSRNYQICFRWVREAECTDCEEDPGQNPFTNEVMDIAQSLGDGIGNCLYDMEAQLGENHAAHCADVDNLNDRLSFKYDLNYYNWTLYYYDRAGSLVRTVAPNGVVPNLSATDRLWHDVKEYQTRYAFNSLGQMVDQQTTDGGKTEFIYNELSEIRFSQNARQAANDQFSYIKYDALHRTIEAGQADLPLDQGVQITFDQLKTMTNLIEDAQFPQADRDQVIVTVYSEPMSMVSYYGEPQRFTQHRVSYMYNDEDGDLNTITDQVYTVFSYDAHGNVEWLVQDVPGIGKSYVSYDYDLISGKVEQINYNEQRNDRFHHRYSYDEDNRITSVETSTDGFNWDQDASYDYYSTGALKRIGIGEDKVQGVDYAYTIHGWLKGINSTTLAAGDDIGGDGASGSMNQNYLADMFGMSLNFYEGDFKHQSSKFDGSNNTMIAGLSTGPDLYNGNISNWVSHHSDEFGDPMGALGAGYQYDKLNRIRSSKINNWNNGAWTPTTNWETSYTYDGNGNLLTLNREGVGSSMDAFDYTYEPNTNKLTHVDDAINGNNYDVDIDDQSVNNYAYDETGNLIQDLSEGISSIEWTEFGKIKAVNRVVGNGDPNLSFTYDAMGNRVTKTVKHSSNPEDWTQYYYTRDANGNTLAMYQRDLEEVTGNPGVYEATYKLTEQPIYGSGRSGVLSNPVQEVMGTYFVDATELDDLSLNQNGLAGDAFDHNWNFATVNSSGTVVGFHHTVDGGSGGNTTIGSFPGSISQNLTTLEDDNGNRIARATGADFFGVSNVFRVFDDNGQMVGTSGIPIQADKNAKSSFVKVPGTINDYYLVTVSPSKDLLYHKFQYQGGQLTADINVINALLHQGGTIGLNIAALELRHLEEGYIYYTAYNNVTSEKELYSIKLDVNGWSNPVLVVTEPSVDQLGEGEIQISSNGEKLAIVNFLNSTIPGFNIYDSEWSVYDLGQGFQSVSGSLTGPAYVNTSHPGNSIEFDHPGEGVFYNNNDGMGNYGTEYYHFATNTINPVTNALGQPTLGDIRRGSGQGVFVTDFDETSALNKVSQPVFGAIGTPVYQNVVSNPSSWMINGLLPQQNVVVNALGNSEIQYARELGIRLYELSDHLGNVRVTFSDRKKASIDNNLLALTADLQSYTDYYPYGMIMTGRNYTSSDYRYGYQGSERDDELKGEGNSYSTYFRQHDPRLGRWSTIDPMHYRYANKSPYMSMGSNPLVNIDPKGDDEFYSLYGELLHSCGEGENSYIVSEQDYYDAICEHGADDQCGVSYFLIQRGQLAYNTEKEAAEAWAPVGFEATRNHPLRLEYGARIARIFTTGGSVNELYLIGSLVEGYIPPEAHLVGAVNPMKSKLFYDVGDEAVNLLALREYYIKKFRYTRFPDEAGHVYLTVKKPVWRVTAVIHTHPPGEKHDGFSADAVPIEHGGGIGGDIGFSTEDKLNVYLVSTTAEKLKWMMLLPRDMPAGMLNTGKLEKVAESWKTDMYFDENGKIESEFPNELSRDDFIRSHPAFQ